MIIEKKRYKKKCPASAWARLYRYCMMRVILCVLLAALSALEYLDAGERQRKEARCAWALAYVFYVRSYAPGLVTSVMLVTRRAWALALAHASTHEGMKAHCRTRTSARGAWRAAAAGQRQHTAPRSHREHGLPCPSRAPHAGSMRQAMDNQSMGSE